ncbi:MAG: glycosyltransferase family 39 protein [Deltaproteobacteria bacterium]|nr:glycosyltransferase family 39 protein [Deltaproteobacteria bacterium]
MARWEVAVVLAVLAVAEFLRLPTLVVPWLRDQVAIHAIVDDVMQGRLSTPFPMPYTTATFHTALGWMFAVFGESMLGPRLVAVALAVASTVATWWLARRWFGPAGALVALALTAFNPLLLSTPAVGLPNEPLPVVLVTLLLYEGVRRDRSAWLVAAGAVFALTLYVRFFVAPMGVFFVVMLLMAAPSWRRLRTALTFAGTAFVLLLPLAGVLLTTEAGQKVLDFVLASATGSTGMHTTLGRSAQRPLGLRAVETAVTLREILFGQMEVAGRTFLTQTNLLGPPVAALGAGLAALRALRPRPGRAIEDRLLFGWLAGALIILTTVVAWPSELLDASLGAHRAPRYFVLLLPAPFLAVGGLVDALAVRFPRGKWGVGALSLVLAVTAAVPTLRRATSSVARDRLSEGWSLLEANLQGDDAVVLLDVPVGTASNWGTPRFLRGWGEGPLLRPEERAPFAADPRLGLALEHPQMLYQLAPQALRLSLDVDGRELPAELFLFEAPLPPLRALSQGSVTTGPGRAHLVLVSSSASLPELTMQAPGERPAVADRIAQFAALNPHIKPVATRMGPGNFAGPAYALYRMELAPRKWTELDLSFGTAAHAAEKPDDAWILPSTAYRPELGFGWDHGFIVAGVGPRSTGLRPEFPGTVRVDVGGPLVEGAITLTARCGTATPEVEINGHPLRSETLRCTGGWGVRQLAFCVEAPAGQLGVRIQGDPSQSAGYAVQTLQLRTASACWNGVKTPDATPP